MRDTRALVVEHRASTSNLSAGNVLDAAIFATPGKIHGRSWMAMRRNIWADIGQNGRDGKKASTDRLFLS